MFNSMFIQFNWYHITIHGKNGVELQKKLLLIQVHKACPLVLPPLLETDCDILN